MTATEIRDADPSEAKALSDLAMRSKAHWGYDGAFIVACREELTVTPRMIASDEVRVAERVGALRGLHRLSVPGRMLASSCYTWTPPRSGPGSAVGYGTTLWRAPSRLGRHVS